MRGPFYHSGVRFGSLCPPTLCPLTRLGAATYHVPSFGLVPIVSRWGWAPRGPEIIPLNLIEVVLA